MQLSPSLYVKRNGPMVFWRVGRLGGSLYLAQSAIPRTNERAFAREARKARLRSLRSQARMASYWQAMWVEQRVILEGRH